MTRHLFQVEYQDVWACYKFGSVKKFPEIVVVSKSEHQDEWQKTEWLLAVD